MARGGWRWLEREVEPLLVLFAVYVLRVIVVLNKPCLWFLRYFEMERQHAMLEDVDAEITRCREQAENHRQRVTRSVEAKMIESGVARLAASYKVNSRLEDEPVYRQPADEFCVVR